MSKTCKEIAREMIAELKEFVARNEDAYNRLSDSDKRARMEALVKVLRAEGLVKVDRFDRIPVGMNPWVLSKDHPTLFGEVSLTKYEVDEAISIHNEMVML